MMIMLYYVVNGLLMKVIYLMIFTVTSGTCWTLCIFDVVMHLHNHLCMCLSQDV